MPEEFFHVNPFRMDEIEEADRDMPIGRKLPMAMEPNRYFFLNLSTRFSFSRNATVFYSRNDRQDQSKHAQ
jgi:hypothetical protein